MRSIDCNELNKILWDHNKWLSSGLSKYKADLCGADLRGFDLYEVVLSGATLCGAFLCGANLHGASLRGVDFLGADLRGADFFGADLREADFLGADLREANFYGADLRGAKNISYIPMVCPDEGAFIGWKKVKTFKYDYLIKLQIPEDAKRSSATTRKCRCDKALVVDIINISTNEHVIEVINYQYHETIYRVGEMVFPDAWDSDRYNECSHGIHFFINRQEALEY